MPSDFKISTTSRNSAADAVAGDHDDGDIQIRTGAPPSNVGDEDEGTLLGTPEFGSTAFGAAASGTAEANAISSATAVASGDAGHFRTRTSGGAVLMQGTAGEAADTPDLTFDNKSVVSGGTIAISSFEITMPIQ